MAVMKTMPSRPLPRLPGQSAGKPRQTKGNTMPTWLGLLVLGGWVGAQGLSAVAGEAATSVFAWGSGYPGPAPGASAIVCDGRTITASNAAISAS